MPEISRFVGIVIRMYFKGKEHNPPHIHVIYGEKAGAIDIRRGIQIDGNLPGPIVIIVNAWMAKHRKELLDMWNTQTIKKI